MKEQKVVVLKITAQKTKYNFISERVEITAINDNYTKLNNQLFRFITKQLEEIRKNNS